MFSIRTGDGIERIWMYTLFGIAAFKIISATVKLFIWTECKNLIYNYPSQIW